MVHIRVLGSFAAERDGEAIPLGGHRQRSVLALLVSARGRVVSVDRMIEELWQGAPPPGPSPRSRPTSPTCAASSNRAGPRAPPPGCW